MRKTKCMIVDDEPLAIKVIASHLGKVTDMEVTVTCTNAIEAYEVVQKQVIDLIFLDIQMPELTGIEFIKSLESPPKIIFTTAFRDYALEGFELDVVDYLLKPVSFPRLLRALEKFRRQKGDQDSTTKDTKTSFLSVRSNRETMRLAIHDILFIESLSDYVQIHLKDRMVICKERISYLAEKLESHGFLRIHRSFLIQPTKLTSYSSDAVKIGENVLPISRSYKLEVKQRLASLQA